MVKIIEELGDQDPKTDFSFISDNIVKKYLVKIQNDQTYRSFHKF